MAKPTVMTTTTLEQVKEQPKVKAFLDRKSRNSKNTAENYLVGLARLQEFLNLQYNGIKLNDIAIIFKEGKDKGKRNGKNKGKGKNHVNVNVYDFIDSFIASLLELGLTPSSIGVYKAAIKGYLTNCDIEINPDKFRDRVTMPKNHKEDEAAITDSDIRKMLLACTNLRLKVYLLVLASGGMRAIEALSIRLKDIDFSTTPTTIHLRAQYTKSKVARDTYISEEATAYLKQWINRKYTIPVEYINRKTKEKISILRPKDDNDLVFQLSTNQKDANPKGMYTKVQFLFQKLLKTIGLEERKENGKRHKVTLHSFRRYVKTVATDRTSSDFSEFLIGHKKSPYFVKTDFEKRMTYATRCMPFLTYLNYTKLEHDAAIKQTELEMLQVKDASKDRDIEALRQQIRDKDHQIKLLQQRDIDSISRMDKLEDEMNDLYSHIKTDTKQIKEEFQPKLKRSLSISEGINESISTVAKSLNDIQKAPQMTDKQKLTHLLEAIGNMVVQVQTSTAKQIMRVK